MSTRNVSAKPTPSTIAADVTARRTKTTGSGAEVYGAETLPVLIRLPDLTRARSLEKPVFQPAAVETAAAEVTMTIPIDSVPDPSPARPERDRKVTGRARPDRDSSMGGRLRRGAREEPPAGWLHGARQFLVAAVLAGVLFGVIVTVQEWNQPTPSPNSVVPRHQSEVPTMDFGQPDLAPAANARSDRDSQSMPSDTVQDQDTNDPETRNTLQGIVPAGMTSFDTGPTPEITTNSASLVSPTSTPSYSAGYAPQRISGQPVAPDAAGYADGADQISGAYGNYPTTPVDPVRAESMSTGPAADATWPPETGPARPVWNADRGPAAQHSRQR